MTLTDDAVALVEQAYLFVQRYQETADAHTFQDDEPCVDWLVEAQSLLAADRDRRAVGPPPKVDPLERIADVLEAVLGETQDGTPFLRIVTGDKK